ncbi:MAG: hypothetical protein ACRC9R_06845, partial [Enterovibrio sp.]
VAPEGSLFISNIGGAPLNSPNLGFLSLNNNIPVISNLDDPKGMAFLDQELAILSDHPNVKLVNTRTNQVLFSLPINNAGFLNDVVGLSTTTALLSDTGTGNVYRIEKTNENTLISTMFINAADLNGNGVNGLLFRNNTLFLVTSSFGGDQRQGHLYRVELDNNFQQVGNIIRLSEDIIGNGMLDGLAANDRMLFVSDWESGESPASIFAFDLEGMNLLYTISGNFASPADISIDRAGRTIYIPEFNNNRVSTLNVSTLN